MKKHGSPSKAGSHATPKIHVVVVDDTATGRNVLVRALSPCPQLRVVGQAEDGQAGLALADKLQPELVITDLQMPGLDGFQLARRLREKYPDMRLIITSAHDGPVCHAVSLLQGADAFITKQRLPNELPALLNRLFPNAAQSAI